MKKLAVIILLVSAFSQLLPGQTISTKSLIEELIDLDGLVVFPNPVYSTTQYSSFDRRSVFPDHPGWFSNSDGFGGEPIPGFIRVLKNPDNQGIGDYLICDLKGPGAIVRLWTARIEGEIIMTLDGQKDPVYAGDAEAFFQHTYEAMLGEKSFDPLWSTTLAQNTAGYYPIPFSKGCKIVWRGKLNTLHFYHVQVREYAQGTKIKTFTIQDIRDNRSRLNEVAAILAKPSEKLDGIMKDATYHAVWLKPGERKILHTLRGKGAIRRLAVHLTAQDLDLALRQTIMDIRFDGAPWGQVQSPAGDFFGVAPGINPYESLPFTVTHDGRMICRYLMPFRDSAQIIFQNLGDQEVTVTTKILDEPYEWREGESMYFRARWRIDHELLADPREVKDIPYLMLRGKGRMVGAAAFLMNPTFVPSSYGNWWGEGDEKIFIDDNLTASFIGTGSEDYFNYAWSSAELFTHAYCGQPRNDGPANRGFVTNYRWHILDNIPFGKSFDFYMELYSHRVVPHFSYGRMIYTYAVAESHDDHLPVTKADVRALRLPENWWPEADGWALNAVFYQVEDLTGGHYLLTPVKDDLWSAGHMMVWTPEKMEDQLDLRVPITESGKYMIAITVGRMARSGKITLLLDGQPLKMDGQEVHDVSTPYRDVSRNLKSGNLDLTEGMHILSIRPAGDTPKPVGLDFIWVKRQ